MSTSLTRAAILTALTTMLIHPMPDPPALEYHPRTPADRQPARRRGRGTQSHRARARSRRMKAARKARWHR